MEFLPDSKAKGALASHQDPTVLAALFDKERNGIVVSEGGCIYVLERLDDAKRRGSNIIAEIAGYRINSDGTDYVLPNPERQEECIRQAIENANLQPDDIDLVILMLLQLRRRRTRVQGNTQCFW